MPGSPEMRYFPTDRPRSAGCFRGSSESFELPGHVVDALELICGREDDALPCALLAAFAALVHRYSDEQEVVVAIPLPAQGQRDGRRSHGPSAFLQPVEIDLAADPGLRDLAAQVGRKYRQLHAAAGRPGAAPSQVGRAEYEAESHPIHRLLFAYSAESKGGVDLGRNGQSPSILPDLARVGNDLALNIARNTRSGLDCTIAFNAELFEPATIRRMLGHLLVLLSSAAANPDGPISSLPIMTDVERRLLIEEWSGPARSTPSPRGKFIHEAFEEQVGALPTPSRSSSRRLV